MANPVFGSAAGPSSRADDPTVGVDESVNRRLVRRRYETRLERLCRYGLRRVWRDTSLQLIHRTYPATVQAMSGKLIFTSSEQRRLSLSLNRPPLPRPWSFAGL